MAVRTSVFGVVGLRLVVGTVRVVSGTPGLRGHPDALSGNHGYHPSPEDHLYRSLVRGPFLGFSQDKDCRFSREPRGPTRNTGDRTLYGRANTPDPEPSVISHLH